MEAIHNHAFEPDPAYPDAMFGYDRECRGYVAYAASMPEALVQGSTKDEAYINLMRTKSTLEPVRHARLQVEGL